MQAAKLISPAFFENGNCKSTDFNFGINTGAFLFQQAGQTQSKSNRARILFTFTRDLLSPLHPPPTRKSSHPVPTILKVRQSCSPDFQTSK
jgi:hypothetical protein